MNTDSESVRRDLLQQLRERFVRQLIGGLPTMVEVIQERFTTLLERGETSRVMQERRDASQMFERMHASWLEGVRHALRSRMQRSLESSDVRITTAQLELIEDDVIENKVLSSRLVLGILEKLGQEYNDLKTRVQFLQDPTPLSSGDVLQPEVISLALIDQWTDVGLTRTAWVSVQDVIQLELSKLLAKAFRSGNEWLISAGVMPEIDLRQRVKRTVDGNASGGRGDTGAARAPAVRVEPTAPAAQGADSWAASYGGGQPSGGQGVLTQLKRMLSQRLGSQAPSPAPAAVGGVGPTQIGGGGQAAGLEGGYSAPGGPGPSPGLQRAMAQAIPAVMPAFEEMPLASGSRVGPRTAVPLGAANDHDVPTLRQPVNVREVAEALQKASNHMKAGAETPSEKATIEIVALMFQAILTEDRIPAQVRVLFARLQIPVLRVALAEPEFFGTLMHPARRLIDHMGSCVLGFDAGALRAGALEAEIRRAVQVIEQYPDSGKRVFEQVYKEFQKFISGFLTEPTTTQRVVSIAQQVEQRETLTIQYTIELRDLLKDLPVREEIRDFLYKIWAEVLSLAAVKYGDQHADTMALKKAASDLVWAASAKPNRGDRARVIQDLPALLQQLRKGMDLISTAQDVQEARIKAVGDALADAFMSRTESIPQERIELMARRLANLENVVIDEGAGDLPLDAQSIELLVGIDASSIEVVADGGAKPSQPMLAWARELELGTWYTLNHNSHVAKVQFVWRSERKHLHLFATADGFSYLIQAGRLAAYLQSKLLVPQENEALTVRATRDALTKLDANPERLFA